MTKYSMIAQYSSLCNLWYWLLMQSYVISRAQSICTHGKSLAKALLHHWKVLVLRQMPWGSTDKRNQVGMATSYPRAYRCKFIPPLLLRSDNFLVIPLMNKQRGRPDVCSQRHACFCSRKHLFLFSGKKLPHMVVSRSRGFHFFFCPGSDIALRHLRQQSVCSISESIPWPKGSGICGWVQSLQFLSLCCQITLGPFLRVNVSILFPPGKVKKEKAWFTLFPFHWIWSSGADRCLIPWLIQYGTELEEYWYIWLFS